MKDITAVLDACVLYPAPLRDLLMHLTLLDGFHAKWSEDIHQEWIRNVLKNRPDLNRGQLERTKRLMNSNVRDCVVKNYAGLMETLDLPDANDRHVLAAAIRSRSDFIVTFNLADFPDEILEKYSLNAIHPDRFIVSLINENTDLVLQAVTRQRKSLKNPPKSLAEFLEILENNGLFETVKYLRLLLNPED